MPLPPSRIPPIIATIFRRVPRGTIPPDDPPWGEGRIAVACVDSFIRDTNRTADGGLNLVFNLPYRRMHFPDMQLGEVVARRPYDTRDPG